MFSLLPRWLLPAVIAGLVLTNCVSHTRLQSEQAAHAKSRAAYAEQVATAHKTRAAEESKRRAAEQELTNANETHAREVEAVRQARAVDRAAGAAVAVRLRDAARATAELAGQVRADSTAAAVREAAADAARVLAELRDESDQRSGILARAADDAHFAGNACARVYNEAREALARH